MKQSAGILVFRQQGAKVEVLLAHPGGPFWGKKDVWSIPKGEAEDGEDLIVCAKREFKEELGLESPEGELLELGSAKASGKINHIWALGANVDTAKFAPKSMVKMEWPPKSGQEIEFPESDKIAWFELNRAKAKLFKNQSEFMDRLAERLNVEIQNSDEPEQTSQQSLF